MLDCDTGTTSNFCFRLGMPGLPDRYHIRSRALAAANSSSVRRPELRRSASRNSWSASSPPPAGGGGAGARGTGGVRALGAAFPAEAFGRGVSCSRRAELRVAELAVTWGVPEISAVRETVPSSPGRPLLANVIRAFPFVGVSRSACGDAICFDGDDCIFLRNPRLQCRHTT